MTAKHPTAVDAAEVTVQADKFIRIVGGLIAVLVTGFLAWLAMAADNLEENITTNARQIEQNARSIETLGRVQTRQTEQIERLIRVIEKAADSAQENRETLIKIATKLEVENHNP